MLITENRLDEWVRSNARDAQGMIVDLVNRLVVASSPAPKERRFPHADSIGQPGPDGILDVDYSFEPFVPEGYSFWEIGTDERVSAKATADFEKLTKAVPQETRLKSIFVFVTPRSGRHKWPYTWKEDAQAKWLDDRRERQEWRDVRIIDGTKLIDWLHQFPSVELWFARTVGWPVQQIETPEQRWSILRDLGNPQLTPQLFLANREAACAKLKEVFAGKSTQLKLETHFPDQVVDFVSAYIASMDEESRFEAVSRCLIISGTDAWNHICALHEKHILIADAPLDLSEGSRLGLLEKARSGGHAVIYGGMPGGIPHPNCEPIPNPKSYQIKEALEKAGYNEERARILAQKSRGNLGSLLRCLQNLSLMPEWAEGSAAAELAIAVLLGSWSENSEADRAVVESLLGKAYGKWIETMREVVLRSGTPLIQRDGTWKFVARYEGWFALGPRFFDEHLDRLRKTVVAVLREEDPQFELPSNERYASQIYGKVLTHSHLLRNGLTESLALLGNHPKALTSCTLGKAEKTADLGVREILKDADWKQWASLNGLLPLLAEAAPREFLNAIEKVLSSDPSLFNEVFAQEGEGFTGTTYMSGVLWALETLAWDAEYFSRAVICLGELDARDPGGHWANRPANSLTTILLPWLPQTCAPVAMRVAAVATLLDDLPDIGWKLLLSLLPETHSTSLGTRKPTWRESIPDNWPKRATDQEYWEQVFRYADLAINTAKSDAKKLAEIIDRLENLPPPAQEQLLAHLGSSLVTAMPETERLAPWTKLVDLVTKHKKYANAEWAMKPELVAKIATLAERLTPDAPAFRYQQLFSERDFDLFEEKGNYEDQYKALEERRQRAVEEICESSGVHAVLKFAASVQSPWRVGIAFGIVAGNDADCAVLPDLLDSEQKSLAQFASGFVWSRFRSRGWQWVNKIEISQWVPAQIGQLLAYLPFTHETWEQSAALLGNDESSYWIKAVATPNKANTNLGFAVDQLIRYERPHAAIRCLHIMLHEKKSLDNRRAVRVLNAALHSSENAHVMDVYEIVEIIKALQDDPATNPDDLFRVEWAYLPLLDPRHRDASPKLLVRRLTNEPGFFCEVIRLIYRSRGENRSLDEPSAQAENIATNANHLLSAWRIPPGYRDDGSYDGVALAVWLDAVKKECSETGYLEAAMTRVGHVLIHTPSDPDGLWIHRSAAATLNAKDAAYMRNGFCNELVNSRGVYNLTAGREEKELAVKYRRQADALGEAGFHRLASSLKEVADDYEREAAQESRRDPFDD